MPRGKRARGFTLIEILVVLGITVLLAALLLPAFWSVRQEGPRTQCQSNLHQLALAIQQYVTDHDGRYPGFFWQADLGPYIGSQGYGWTTKPNGQVVMASGKSPVLYCPNSSVKDDALSYQYNYTLVKFSPAAAAGRFESEFPQPAEVAGFYDAYRRYPPGDPGDPRASAAACPGWSLDLSARHSGGANYAFLDAHVKWMTPQQYVDLYCSVLKGSS